MAAKTAGELSPDELEAYRRAVRKRAALEQRRLALRRARAWELAREVATLLRKRFGASRVVVFGSLVHAGRFGPWSDLDIAVWGLSGRGFLRAVAATFEMDPEVPVNLVDAEDCPPALRASIEGDGVEL